jgi:hypothetical protein
MTKIQISDHIDFPETAAATVSTKLCTINMNEAFYIPLVHMKYVFPYFVFVAIAFHRYGTILPQYKSEM